MGLFDRLFKSQSAPRGPKCLACDSTELEWLASEAYRCRICGHEGGDGFATHAKAEAAKKIHALAPEARRALAERSHTQAGDVLAGIHLDSLRIDKVRAATDALLRVGASLAGMQVLADDAREERDRAITAVVRELAEAERLLVDCGHALGRGDVLSRSITMASAKLASKPQVLERHTNYLRELHAWLAGELAAGPTRAT